MRLCLYLKVICMLYNKIHTDEQINVLCGTVEKKSRKMNIVGDIRLQGNQCRASRSTLNLTLHSIFQEIGPTKTSYISNSKPSDLKF